MFSALWFQVNSTIYISFELNVIENETTMFFLQTWFIQ